MPESLKVIALISGGKDSLFSILHCLANGHAIVALANLFPESDICGTDGGLTKTDATERGEEQAYPADIDDIESHMYQTIGHSTIPLYASALGIPVYRQPIRGTAVNKSKSYHPSTSSSTAPQAVPKVKHDDQSEESLDETESLVPLLQKVKAHHPDANALSTGAILSTYQRTRVESVALRLGLIPLAFLWQYPMLEPYTQSSLLHDMHAVGMDARIIKVASGGLDAAMLWENVADLRVIRRLSTSMQRYADAGGIQVGAVLGEGGEFETLAVDGPSVLFAKKIVVAEGDRREVKGEGGTASIRILEATVAEKEDGMSTEQTERREARGLEQLRKPSLWDDEFEELLRLMNRDDSDNIMQRTSMCSSEHVSLLVMANAQPVTRQAIIINPSTIYLSNVTASSLSVSSSPHLDSRSQATQIIATVRAGLSAQGLEPSDISFTTILLRSMGSFGSVNEIYGSLFTLPNPPARFCVAVGDALPPDVDVCMSFVIERRQALPRNASSAAETKVERPYSEEREVLHVQSRSYWAPANIGPYSQAVSVPAERGSASAGVCENSLEGDSKSGGGYIVHVAGQIPLVPATLSLLESTDFREQAVLGLQHLWRIGRAMGVEWWGGGAVAFIAADSPEAVKERVNVVVNAWIGIHAILAKKDEPKDGEASDEEDDDADIGDAALYSPWNVSAHAARTGALSDRIHRPVLPNWACVQNRQRQSAPKADTEYPPCFIAEVAELPRGASVEWWSLGLVSKGENLRVEVSDGGKTCAMGNMCIAWRACMNLVELRDFAKRTTTPHHQDLSEDEEVFLEIFTAYGINDNTILELGPMVVPCNKVWDSTGTELFAAVRWRGPYKPPV